MSTSRAWEPRDPSVAFFPVEMRPLFMQNLGGTVGYQKLKRHFAVVVTCPVSSGHCHVDFGFA